MSSGQKGPFPRPCLVQQAGWELAGSWARGEGAPAWGNSCLPRPGTSLPTCSPCTAVQLPRFTAVGTGLVTFPSYPPHCKSHRVIKHGGGTACSSIRESQRFAWMPSASMYYLRCVTKLFVRKLLCSSDFFSAPSII